MKAQNFNRLFGMYDLTLTGNRLERFLNIVTFHGIDLRGIAYEETGQQEGLYPVSSFQSKKCRIRIKREDLQEFLRLCEKYHIEVEKQKELGLPGMIKYYHVRVAFIAGAVCCFLFLLYMSHCIWEIEIKGNSYYTQEYLLDYLEEKNITYGCFRSSFSCEKEELTLRKKHDRIAWCSMSVEGCKLILTITENKVFEENAQEKKGWSIVADRSATISSIVTRTGTPLVKQNEKVKKGQVLVAGYLIYKDDYDTSTGVKKCVADADIYAVYNRKVSQTVSRSRVISTVVKQEHSTAFFYQDTLLGRRIKQKKQEQTALLTEYQQNRYLLRIFPKLYRLKRTKLYYEEKEVTLSQQEASIEAENEMEQYCKKIEENGCKIIEKKLDLEHNKKEVVLSGTITVQERFCTYKQTKLPEVGKESDES